MFPHAGSIYSTTVGIVKVFIVHQRFGTYRINYGTADGSRHYATYGEWCYMRPVEIKWDECLSIISKGVNSHANS